MQFPKLLFAGLLLVAAFAGCSSSPVVPQSAQAPFSATDVTFASGDSRVGSYISSWKGFRTSSYWIEGPTGLILIDTQFLPSAAEEFLNLAEKWTGKKAVLAIVLHPNPDKFNGTAVFQKRGVRVVTSEQVLAKIPEVHQLRTKWFYDDFKPDYPIAEPRPESFGSHTADLTAGGITVKAHVLGAGCSDAHVVVEYEGHFFVGDLITQGFHSWLELGLLDEWLKRLAEIRTFQLKWVHTGRGGSGDADLIDRQEEYLKTVLQVVRKRRPRMENRSRMKWPMKSLVKCRNGTPVTNSRDLSIMGLGLSWKNVAK